MSRVSFAALICRKLFAGHVVSSRPMKWKEKIHRMITKFHFQEISFAQSAKRTTTFYQWWTNAMEKTRSPDTRTTKDRVLWKDVANMVEGRFAFSRMKNLLWKKYGEYFYAFHIKKQTCLLWSVTNLFALWICTRALFPMKLLWRTKF